MTRFPKRTVAFLLFLLLASAAFAQDMRDYTKPKSHVPSFVAPYTPQEVPEVNFENSSRLEPLLRDGNIMLSLSDAIALALENNLDLAIARYNLSIADTDILRTKSGASVRGVATGLVQGTPGGGVGGFGGGASGSGAGGTSGGAGGAGSGASGLVQSTLGSGASVESFDPVLSGNLAINHATFPLSNIVTTGVPTFQQNTGSAGFNYSQAFGTGTSISVGFDNSRTTTNSLFTTLVPELRSSFRFTMRQRLLSGFGFGPNLRFIRIARNNREISDIAFRNQVIATVSQIQNMYWDLVNAFEDVSVRQRSLALAEKTLSDNRKQVELGSLAPIEVVRAESEVALRNQELILAQTTLQLQQLLMKNALTRNLRDPILAAAPVVPTDTMHVAAQEEVVPIQDLIQQALQHRPELSQARIDLTNRQITRKAVRNSMLPNLDFVAWYGASGLAGNQNPKATCTNAAADPSGCDAADSQAGRFLPQDSIRRTGLGNAFATLFDHRTPDYGVGINLAIPIRNRAAQADQVRSELEYRQAEIRFQQLQNQITIEVRNAQFTVQQSRARYDAARKARDLAAHTLDIETKRNALGAGTNFEVLQAQRDLAVAESTLVSAMTEHERARVELDRVTGMTLQRNGIDVGEAERGRVERQPTIPGVTPRAEAPKGPAELPAGGLGLQWSPQR